jgi:hypothetical protein
MAMNWRAFVERLDRAKPSQLRTAIGTIVVVAMIGLIAHGNYAASGDALHYMVIAHSIAFDRDVDLDNDYSEPSRIITEPAGAHAQRGRDGVLRPIHDVGLPFVAAPFFAGAYRLAELTDGLPLSLRRRAKLDRFIALRQLVAVEMIFVTGALAILFFETTWRLTGQKALAAVWAIVWTLSPPVLSHGYVFFTEIPSALVALLVYSRLADDPRRQTARVLLLLGLLTGFLFLIHVRTLGIILALLSIVVWRARGSARHASAFAAGVAAMGLVKLWINLHFWGTPFTTPLEQPGIWPGMAALVSESAVRLSGLLLDARHGLLPSAPVYLLVPAAWLLLGQRSKRVRNELMTIVGAYLLFVVLPLTNIHGWRAGWAPAARFIMPIAPFLGLAVPLVLAPAAAAEAFSMAIVLVQLALDAFFWGHPMLFWSEGPGPAPFLERLVGGRLASAIPPMDSPGPSTLTIALLSLMLWAALTWWITSRGNAARRSAPAPSHLLREP